MKRQSDADIPAPSGPRAPQLYEWVEVENYPGFRARIWVNAPMRVNQELRSGETGRLTAVLKRLVAEHNGWCDVDGNPYPPAESDEFWDSIDIHLYRSIMHTVSQAAWQTPLVKPAGGQ